MQDYLGHRDPKHTAHYTRVAGHRFEPGHRVEGIDPARLQGLIGPAPRPRAYEAESFDAAHHERCSIFTALPVD